MKKILLYAITVFCISYTIAQPTAGLVAYWPMNGNFTDAGPYAINGSSIGATATTNSSGTANTAMAFNNPTSTVVQYGTHPINANLNFGASQDFSISFSTFANSPFVHNGGFYDNNLNHGGYGIWFWNSAGFPQIYFNYRNGATGTTNGAFQLGVWTKVCCVREGSALRIYINGVLNVTGTVGTMTPTYTYTGRFGTMFYGLQSPQEYNGGNEKLDEFRIYNRALTPAEIMTLATLPVKLSNFTATKNNADVLLQWQTEYEQNSSHFNIQRSIDGINFSTITTVQAKGNSSLISNYQFTDNTAKNLANVKTVFYRLEMVDIDTRKENSSTVTVKLDADKKELTILQNPTGNDLRIQFSSSVKEIAHLAITDAAGKQLLTKQIQINIGTVSTAIPVNALAAGNYYITVTSTQGKQTKAFLKQ